jgi:hypothetical protein
MVSLASQTSRIDATLFGVGLNQTFISSGSLVHAEDVRTAYSRRTLRGCPRSHRLTGFCAACGGPRAHAWPPASLAAPAIPFEDLLVQPVVRIAAQPNCRVLGLPPSKCAPPRKSAQIISRQYAGYLSDPSIHGAPDGTRSSLKRIVITRRGALIRCECHGVFFEGLLVPSLGSCFDHVVPNQWHV